VLTYLPKPYDDELLYSIIARYFAHVGGSRFSGVDHLFGNRNIITKVDLPCFLERLAVNTAALWKLNAESIAAKHTLFPYYTHFVNDSVREKAVKMILSDNGRGLHLRLGINGSRVPLPKVLRYCPQCAAHDLKRLGETYWRRHHQLPGVLVCTEHRATLAYSTAAYRPMRWQQFIDASHATCDPFFPQPEPRKEHLDSAWKIALRCKNFVQGIKNQWDCDDRIHRYRDTAIRAGFVGKMHHLHSYIIHAKLEKSFVDFFGAELLSSIGCDVHLGFENWLRNMFRTKFRYHHPLHHALLQIFLEEVPVTAKLPPPFGIGPWKCPNRFCNQGTGRSVTSIRIKHGTDGKPVALAKCFCGFSFWFRAVEGGCPVVDKVISYGPTWIEKAKNLIGSGLSRQAASEVLGTNESTIRGFFKETSKTCNTLHANKESVLRWRK
jgi:hypothetical protein